MKAGARAVAGGLHSLLRNGRVREEHGRLVDKLYVRIQGVEDEVSADCESRSERCDVPARDGK